MYFISRFPFHAPYEDCGRSCIPRVAFLFSALIGQSDIVSIQILFFLFKKCLPTESRLQEELQLSQLQCIAKGKRISGQRCAFKGTLLLAPCCVGLALDREQGNECCQFKGTADKMQNPLFRSRTTPFHTMRLFHSLSLLTTRGASKWGSCTSSHDLSFLVTLPPTSPLGIFSSFLILVLTPHFM